MHIPIKRHPSTIHCRGAIFRHTAVLLTAVGWMAWVCMPGDSVAQQSESKQPSQNAADSYRRAVATIERLSASDRVFIESTGQLELLSLYAPLSSWSEKELVRFSEVVLADEKAGELAARLEPAMRLFRQGAESRQCDWGFDFHSGNLGTPIPHLGMVTDLVRCAVFRARYHWAIGSKPEAVNDLQALKKFARHVGADGDGGLICLVVQYNVERVVGYTISQWLVDPESARTLREVAREPSRSSMNLAKKALLLETVTLLPLARRLIDSSGLTAEQRRQRDKKDLVEDVVTIGELVKRYSEERLLAQIEQAHGHYKEVGRLLDLPVDEFQTKFDKYTSEVDETGNIFSGMGVVRCPGIERVYYDVKEMRVRWRMLQAAIDIHQFGIEAPSRHKDPFGEGPFEYDSSGDGFVLRSRLIVNGTPVSMRFDGCQRIP